jgi:microcin C transport system substrate-binding protein
MNRLALLALFLILASSAWSTPPTDLPAGLQWITNDYDKPFASPEAKRGGRFRTFMTTFPLTLRLVGPDSNGSFAGYLRANALGLVDRHPNTHNPIPELATHWAFDPDGKTVYYKLDPGALWSDGKPVTADDYLYTLEFMRSRHIVAPWYNNHYNTVIIDVVKYDDYTIAIEGATAKPRDELLYEYGLQPTPRHFHVLDSNWVRDYNWKIEPNTGPYQITEIRKGKYIEFTRKADWWGNTKRFFKYRFNPDKVRVKVIRDTNIAYKYFAKGELDTFGLVMPRFWYKKATGRPYDRGYISKVKFYNDVPQPAMGIFLNEADSLLADRNVRLGLAYAMNVEKVIETVLRGDYERLQTHHEGYGDYTNRSITARPFDLVKANEHLDRAGWQQRGSDGIRIKGEQRLSLRVTYYRSDHTARLVVLKQEALKAGIELTLQLLDPSTAFKQILEKKHQVAWMGWAGGGVAPRFWQHYHSDNANKPQTNNITNTAYPLLDEKIMAYRASTEKEERIRLAHELEQLVHDQAAFIPTFKVPYTREAYWRWIKLPEWIGTRSSTSLFSPFGSTGGLFWIDEQEKERTMDARLFGSAFEPIVIIDDTWRKVQ